MAALTRQQEEIVARLAKIDRDRTLALESLLESGESVEDVCFCLDEYHHQTITLGREFDAIERSKSR